MQKTQRIVGIDIARALAIVGMIIVNFKMVIGSQGDGWLVWVVDFFSGKAAALFVVLAGVGIALMTRTGRLTMDAKTINRDRIKLMKRSLLLFVVGLSYMPIWPADILHFYGVYMLFTIPFLYTVNRRVLFSAVAIIMMYPILMWIFEYDIGWDFETLAYHGFWSFDGFMRNLFFNGFHPVFPWVSFMLVGLWMGRQELHEAKVVKKLLFQGVTTFILLWMLSKILLLLTISNDPIENEQLSFILGMSPMPPLPIYMLAGSALSVSVISLCILMGRLFEKHKMLVYLMNYGRMALTIYVLHVVVGMGLIIVYDESMVGNYSLNFTFLYALIFNFIGIVFSNVWLQYYKIGPLEWLFKKIVG